MRLFGFEIQRAKDLEPPVSFAPENKDDGAVNVAAGGAWGTYVDLDGSIRTEAELVNKYREMAFNPEIDAAMDEVTNEAIISEEGKETVEIILDDLPIKPGLKNVFIEEFKQIQKLLEFHIKPYDIFKTWYRDGRLYYHIIIDEKAPELGIKELRYLDPRKIRKIRENVKKSAPEINQGQSITLQKSGKEYYIYNERGLFAGNKSLTPQTNMTGIKIAKDSILHCTSGINDRNGRMILSHLHKAIRPLNQLRALEDATIIYRISRAPERRIFYIDVGNLPKMKAEQYLRDIMTKYKNRLVYDASTGEIRDDRRFQTMLEDFWLPRREGGRGTEISTLPAGQNLGELADVEYFQRKLYKSLNVPVSRLEPETTYNLGRATEISRDEIRFMKFIDRLRLKFNELFLRALETQLILKGTLTPEEWEEIKHMIKFKYLRDNYMSELKDQEIMQQRFNLANEAMQFAGKLTSYTRIRKDILKQTDEDYDLINNEIAQEMQDPQYNPPMEDPAMYPQVPNQGQQ